MDSITCGFDFLPQPATPAEPAVPEMRKVSQVELEPGCFPPRPTYPPYPQAADPNGQLTNVPHEHSRNMPHPLACRDYFEEQARRMKAQARGYDDEE
jgi:hypothetical protein